MVAMHGAALFPLQASRDARLRIAHTLMAG